MPLLETILGIVVISGVGILGAACVLRPDVIQRFYVRQMDAHKARWGTFIPFSEWARRPSYLGYLRLSGIVFIVFSLVFLIGAWLEK
jgi:hypothetical protein